MAGQPNWHHRQTRHSRVQRCQVLNGAIQNTAIIQPGAQHNLGIDIHAEAAESLELRQDVWRVAVVEQLAPHSGIRGVD